MGSANCRVGKDLNDADRRLHPFLWVVNVRNLDCHYFYYFNGQLEYGKRIEEEVRNTKQGRMEKRNRPEKGCHWEESSRKGRFESGDGQ